MAKLTNSQFEAIAQCCIDAKRDSLTFMQSIESAARREAFKEAAQACQLFREHYPHSGRKQGAEAARAAILDLAEKDGGSAEG